MRLTRCTSVETKVSVPSVGGSNADFRMPRRPDATASNAWSITTASAHLDAIHCA